MELLVLIKNDYFQAMKDKDQLKKGVLSLLISAINSKEKELSSALSDEQILPIIQKEIKQAKETLALTPSDRIESIKQTEAKLALLASYLPKQMDNKELVDAIMEVAVAQNLELIKKNQGLFMKQVMINCQGKTDGKSLSQVLGTLLK